MSENKHQSNELTNFELEILNDIKRSFHNISEEDAKGLLNVAKDLGESCALDNEGDRLWGWTLKKQQMY